MKKLQTILVATDFQKSSTEAVRVAAEFAKKFRSRVTLIHVLYSPVDWPPEMPSLRREAATALQESVSELEAQNVVIDESTILQGYPSETILHKAIEIDANLIVMGSGHEVDMSSSVGPVAESIMAHSNIPVLAVRPGMKHQLQNIVCPVNMSEVSSRGLRNAIWLADAFDASLLVMTVIPEHHALFGTREMDEEFSKKTEAQWKHKLSELLDQHDFGKVTWGHAVRMGTPHREIIHATQENDADLVVMGSSGRTGLARAVLGSVTRRVTQQLPCSILTLKHEDVVSEWLDSEVEMMKILFAEGDALFGTKAYEAALKKYRQVLIRNPYSVRAIEGEAKAHEKLGNQSHAELLRNRAAALREQQEGVTV